MSSLNLKKTSDPEIAKQLSLHRAKWESCRLCSIGSSHKVFFRGSTPCKFLFIGEAPGPSETVTKVPFTGKAGKLLKKIMSKAGLTTDYGICNVIACFPADEDRPTTFREPSATEIHNCKPRLDELVELCEASYYIALGKTAEKNPPTGIDYHLFLHHPSYIERRGGETSLEFKRTVHQLKAFIRDKT